MCPLMSGPEGGGPSLHRGVPLDVWPGGGRGLRCTVVCPPHAFSVRRSGPMDWAFWVAVLARTGGRPSLHRGVPPPVLGPQDGS